MTISGPYRRYGETAGLPMVPGTVTTDRRGRAFANLMGDPVWIFDSTGRFIGHLGPKGRGPGEFSAAGPVAIGPADSLYASDPSEGRLSVLAPDLKFIRSVPFPPGAHAMIWVPRLARLVISAPPSDLRTVGARYHVFDLAGTRHNSFGARAQARADDYLESERRIALADDTTFAAVTVTTPIRLELWSLAGDMRGWYQIDDSAFRRKPARSADGLTAPPPGVASVRFDANGLLWALVLDHDANWRQGIEVTPVGREFRVDYIDPARFWDSIVLVADLRTRKIVARLRSPLGCLGFAEPASIICAAANQDETIRLEARYIGLSPSAPTLQ